jgi:uncharacterized membrane protein (DUF441 family)
MARTNANDQLHEAGSTDRALITKFGLLLFLGLLLLYAKFLWPLVFGRMHVEGIALTAALQDASLHTAAFTALALTWIAAAAWVYVRSRAMR